jgi:copper chaperone NosL
MLPPAFRRIVQLTLLVLAAIATVRCSAPGPGVIHYDTDSCDHCRMTISDPRFAAQLVTRTGKVYRFDDPGCLAAFLASRQVTPETVHSIWTNDYAHPERLLRAEESTFVVSDRIRSPMNGGMAAFGSATDAAAFQSTVAGRVEAWADALKRGRS